MERMQVTVARVQELFLRSNSAFHSSCDAYGTFADTNKARSVFVGLANEPLDKALRTRDDLLQRLNEITNGGEKFDLVLGEHQFLIDQAFVDGLPEAVRSITSTNTQAHSDRARGLPVGLSPEIRGQNLNALINKSVDVAFLGKFDLDKVCDYADSKKISYLIPDIAEPSAYVEKVRQARYAIVGAYRDFDMTAVWDALRLGCTVLLANGPELKVYEGLPVNHVKSVAAGIDLVVSGATPAMHDGSNKGLNLSDWLPESARLDADAETYYGLNQLDRKLKRFLKQNPGYFVELGANDGKTQSNTKYFEESCGWRGVLVEPTLNNFLECISHRSENTSIYCNACVSFEFSGEYVPLVYSNLMTAPMQLQSDVKDPREHARRGSRFLKNKREVVEFAAKATTLNALLDKSEAPNQIDFLSLDVEGAEIEVLKGVDHQKYRFSVICLECRDFPKMKNYLESVGYAFAEQITFHDYVFVDAR